MSKSLVSVMLFQKYHLEHCEVHAGSLLQAFTHSTCASCTSTAHLDAPDTEFSGQFGFNPKWMFLAVQIDTRKVEYFILTTDKHWE